MPSTISWRKRCSMSPPYRRLVMAAISGAVGVDGGVEQVQVDPADLDLPDVEPGDVAGQVDRDLHARSGVSARPCGSSRGKRSSC